MMDDADPATFRKLQDSLTQAKKTKLNAARDEERQLTLKKQEEAEAVLLETMLKKQQ